MPIVVDHTPSGLTSVIAAGLAAAENQRKLELADKLGLETRRLDIAQQGQQLDQRRFESQQADIPLARQHAADMVNLQYDRLGQRDEQQSQLRVQEAQQRADAMLSPMQQSQLKKLDEQELMVNSTPTLMPAAKEMMLAQIDQKRHTIRNQKGGSRPSPFPEGRDVGDVWEDASGAVFSRDKDGNVKLLVRPDQRKGAAADDRKNPEMFRKRYDSLRKSMMTVTDTGERRFPGREEILQAIKDEDEAFATYAGNGGGGSGSDPSFIGPVASGPMTPALADPAASTPLTPQAAAGRAAQQSEMDRLIPPNHPFRGLDASDTLPAKGGGVYTAAELAQIARLKQMPIDQVLSVLVDAATPRTARPPLVRPVMRSNPAASTGGGFDAGGP